MKTRPLSEGERMLLSAALINQARLERVQGLPKELHSRLEEAHGSEALGDLNRFVNQSQERGDLYEFFARLILRGSLVVSNPLIVPEQA